MAAVAIAPDGTTHPIHWESDTLIPVARYRRSTDPTWLPDRRFPSVAINHGVITATGDEVPHGWTVLETHRRPLGRRRTIVHQYESAAYRIAGVQWARSEATT